VNGEANWDHKVAIHSDRFEREHPADVPEWDTVAPLYTVKNVTSLFSIQNRHQSQRQATKFSSPYLVDEPPWNVKEAQQKLELDLRLKIRENIFDTSENFLGELRAN
jgi:hypothetical protein